MSGKPAEEQLLYAAKYLTYMPTQEELRREIEYLSLYERLFWRRYNWGLLSPFVLFWQKRRKGKRPQCGVEYLVYFNNYLCMEWIGFPFSEVY